MAEYLTGPPQSGSREMSPDCRRIGIIQFCVRLHLPEFCDTPLGDERVDICGRELELKSHDLSPVFGPDIFNDARIQVFHEVKPELTVLFDNE